MKNIESYYEYYTEGTADDAETVLLIPGVGCGAFFFRDALKYFLPNYKVVLFENPGFNGTPIPAILSVEKITDIVVKVLKHLKIKKCHVIGHSMGGFTAQQLALSYPKMVMNLVLVSTSYGGPHSIKDARELAGIVGFDVTKYRKKGNNPTKPIEFIFSEKYKTEHKKEFDDFCEFYLRESLNEYLTVRHFICGSKFSSYLTVHNIKARSLVVHGMEDRLITKEGGENLARRIAGSYYWNIPECGHVPMVERPDFYPRIIDFITGEEVGIKLPYSEPPHDVREYHLANLFKSVVKGLFKK